MRIVILVRKSLKMVPGKEAAQCVHAALGLGCMDPLTSVIVLHVSDKKFNEAKLENYSYAASYVQMDLGINDPTLSGVETCLARLETDE